MNEKEKTTTANTVTVIGISTMLLIAGLPAIWTLSTAAIGTVGLIYLNTR